MQTASQKVINAWCLYDWANSAYNLVITSTIFPAYYEYVSGDNNPATIGDKVNFLGREYINSALYNYALAFAFLIVAIISPILSSIADYKGNKKKLHEFFSYDGEYGMCCFIFL
jgi:MFS transporter, UMF1 family